MPNAGEFSRLKGALFTTDAQVLSVMNQVLDNFEIDTEVCIDPLAALEAVRTMKLDTLITDWIDKDSAEIVRALRSSEQNTKTTVLAMVGGDHEMQAATQTGANFTMYKPLSVDQATRFLRAAYGNMLLQRRRAARCQVDIPVAVNAVGIGPIVAQMIDLSVKGMAFRCTHEIRVDQQLAMEFTLPGTTVALHVNGRATNVTKSSTHTRVGVCFSSAPNKEFELLEQWISDQLVQLPGVLNSSHERGKTSL